MLSWSIFYADFTCIHSNSLLCMCKKLFSCVFVEVYAGRHYSHTVKLISKIISSLT